MKLFNNNKDSTKLLIQNDIYFYLNKSKSTNNKLFEMYI